MEAWTLIRSQKDIGRLLAAYAGFHDACLADLHYRSGIGVETYGAMHLSGPEERVLTAVFHSPWAGRLALRFSGVRRFSAAGWQERHDKAIPGCYLAIRTDLLPNQEEPLIVWADSEAFSPEQEVGALPPEPMASFVIASQLEWRRLL